ncbi:MAG: GntR family transcriptional regulator [Pseudomonadota bacterium]
MPKSDPATRRTTADHIATTLVDDIAAGLLGPGQRLDEVGLAERFGASRTPVREALNRLVAQSILTTSGGRGVRVADYSRLQLAQIFEAMQEMEAVCARLAAQRLTLLSRAEIGSAQRACEDAARAGDRIAFLKANEAFHQAIYRATQNPYVAELAASFRHRTGPFRAKRYRTQDDLLHSIETHAALVRTIFGSSDAESDAALRRRMADDFIATLGAA